MKVGDAIDSRLTGVLSDQLDMCDYDRDAAQLQSDMRLGG